MYIVAVLLNTSRGLDNMLQTHLGFTKCVVGQSVRLVHQDALRKVEVRL